MLLTQELDERFHHLLSTKFRCTICLSPLFYSFIDGKRDELFCESCTSTFLITDRLPIFLFEDENWRKKADEIEGEFTYNIKGIPREVHIERNTFVDNNTEMFLKESRLDLLGDDILIIGCSMAELEFFIPKCKSVVSLDIVPSLARACLEATRQREIAAAWVCGDGECLAFEEESFDAVIVRQTLHHMLKYYSAICEFFRVCKRGGYVLIIDEPFSPLDLNDLPFLSLGDDFFVYKDLQLRQIRRKINIPHPLATENSGKIDINLLERKRQYVKPDPQNVETFLADKYHSFSLLNCLFGILLHSRNFQLTWPREIAWTDETADIIRFCHGPNPHFQKDLLDKLVSPGNVSIAAKKWERTTVFRNRSDVRALPLDEAYKLASG